MRFHLRTRQNEYIHIVRIYIRSLVETYTCIYVGTRERTFRLARANIACIIQGPGDWLHQPLQDRLLHKRWRGKPSYEYKRTRSERIPDLYSLITTTRRRYNCTLRARSFFHLFFQNFSWHRMRRLRLWFINFDSVMQVSDVFACPHNLIGNQWEHWLF